MNRRIRRMMRFTKAFSARRSSGEMVDTGRKLERSSRPPDVLSARAKSRRHRRSTSDKWNQ
jgi:hypothetical protein